MNLTFWLPETLSLLAGLGLIAASFLTSAMSAAMGLGGGMTLIAIMANVMPGAALVPVHGLVQIGSNSGRALVLARHVDPKILLWYCAGSIAGAVCGGFIAIRLPVPVLQIGIAFFILWSVWGSKPVFHRLALRAVAAGGFLATLLGMFFGASGPIGGAVLAALGLTRHQFVANQAATSLASHILKIVVFGTLGFAFAPWIWLALAMIVSGFAGTLAGSHLLGRMDEAMFRKGFRVLMSALCANLIFRAIVNSSQLIN